MAPKIFRVIVICTFVWTWSTGAEDAKAEILTNRTNNLNKTFNSLQDTNHAVVSSQTISSQAEFNQTSTSDRTSEISAAANFKDFTKSENLTSSSSTGTTQKSTSTAPTLESEIAGIPGEATNSFLENGTSPNFLSEVNTFSTQSYSISGQTSSSADVINPLSSAPKSSLFTPLLDTNSTAELGVPPFSDVASSSPSLPTLSSASMSRSPLSETSISPDLSSPVSSSLTSPITHFFHSSDASSSLSSFVSASSPSVLLPSPLLIKSSSTAPTATSFPISLTSTLTIPPSSSSSSSSSIYSSSSSFRSTSLSSVPSSTASLLSFITSTVPIPLTHSRTRDDARTLENTVNPNNELRTTTTTSTMRTSIGNLITSTALVSENKVHTSSPPPSPVSTAENSAGESTSSSSEEEEIQVKTILIINVKDDEDFQD